MGYLLPGFLLAVWPWAGCIPPTTATVPLEVALSSSLSCQFQQLLVPSPARPLVMTALFLVLNTVLALVFFLKLLTPQSIVLYYVFVKLSSFECLVSMSVFPAGSLTGIISHPVGGLPSSLAMLPELNIY